MNRKTRAILAFNVVQERTWDTMQPLVDHVFSLVPQVHQFYSDGFSTYHELVLPRTGLSTGKAGRTS